MLITQGIRCFVTDGQKQVGEIANQDVCSAGIRALKVCQEPYSLRVVGGEEECGIMPNSGWTQVGHGVGEILQS